MRVCPVDRVAKQHDRFCRWCNLQQPPWCQRVEECVWCSFASNNARRELSRKLPEVPGETAFVAICEEMELLRRCGDHLGVGTQVRMQRCRAAALRAVDDEIWRSNHSVAQAWNIQIIGDSTPDLGDADDSVVPEDDVNVYLPD